MYTALVCLSYYYQQKCTSKGEACISKTVASTSSDLSPLIHICKTHLEFCVQLWAPQYTKTWTYSSESNRDNQDDQGAGEQDIWGKAERPGLVQPGKDKDLIVVFNWLEYIENTKCDFLEVYSDRMEGNQHKLEHGNFQLCIWILFFHCQIL